jgi:hypothetical protein
LNHHQFISRRTYSQDFFSFLKIIFHIYLTNYCQNNHCQVIPSKKNCNARHIKYGACLFFWPLMRHYWLNYLQVATGGRLNFSSIHILYVVHCRKQKNAIEYYLHLHFLLLQRPFFLHKMSLLLSNSTINNLLEDNPRLQVRRRMGETVLVSYDSPICELNKYHRE